MAVASKKQAQVGLTWEDLCKDPYLQDLPYKIELNEWGQIVMSPTYQYHGAFQDEIVHLLRRPTDRPGTVVTESAIRTEKGAKVADVAWFSEGRWEQVKGEYDASVALEICVEVLSPPNAPGEIEQKRKLYFQAGASEVWTCDREGTMRFYEADGERDASALVPDFPQSIEL